MSQTQTDDDILSIRVPSFNELGSSEEEKFANFHISNQLQSVISYYRSIAAALELSRFSEAKFNEVLQRRRAVLSAGEFQQANRLREAMSTFGSWQSIAGRDATMSVYHFGVALESINFKDTPALRRVVDHAALRKARNDFRLAFPASEKARHAVGHSADRARTRQAQEHVSHAGGMDKPNVKIEPGASFVMTGTMIGDEMTSTSRHIHTGKTEVVSVSLNEETVAKLKAIVLLTCQAFIPAEEAWRQRVAERIAKPSPLEQSQIARQ